MSLEDFQPQLFTGGPTRFFLPLFHEIIAREKPRLVVTLGLSDAQAHLTFCQTAAAEKLTTQCFGVRRPRDGQKEADSGWRRASEASARFFPATSRLIEFAPEIAIAGETVEVLLIDDVDDAETIREELKSWKPKLAPNALILLHGLNLERADPPRKAWQEFVHGLVAEEFSEGIGLGLATSKAGAQTTLFRQSLFGANENEREQLRVAAALIAARAGRERTKEELNLLRARQLWFDTIVEDRSKAQQRDERRTNELEQVTRNFSALHEDRRKAQEVMDHQRRALESLEQECARNEKELAKLHQIIVEAEARRHRSVAQKIAREIKRIPRNLRRLASAPPAKIPAAKEKDIAPAPARDRYQDWMAQHEPGPAELEEQRRMAKAWGDSSPLISLLIPVHETPPQFLEELFVSLQAQTNENWEACVVDGGTKNRTTLAVLQKWKQLEPRLHLERLEQNSGIAGNTNHALCMAGGAYVALVDHDDTLAAWALFEVAKAIRQRPAAEIFYSDEDRLTAAGKRANPFFKPDWSPALLLSFMYVGHLTIYKRELARALGGLRAEYNLSQDYDLILRASEQAREIVHLPHVLYHWREHAASGASGGKPHARASNLAALADAMQRRGLPAEVLEYPTANRARMRLSNPTVAVIIPTDSPERARLCAADLAATAAYPKAEFILVTNSGLIAQLKKEVDSERVRFVAFDEPFNFSAKCNVGARATQAERLIFLNDDVIAQSTDWIENVIEPLENPAVGAVSPKMLYESGRIQHAGLVTGVRGLIGTAAHQWPGDSTDYANFAQSMRDVAALSAACLAMRWDDFFRINGFDGINTPIGHSDVDLCFKIRERGLRCVYTPFATMIHRGHASIGAMKEPAACRQDKSSIYLLQRWAKFTCHDPYFPKNMRDWLYADSPEPTQLCARKNLAARGWNHDLLLAIEDLSSNGLSISVLELAKWRDEKGVFVAIISAKDGPRREEIIAADIPLIIDPLITVELARWRESRGHAVKRKATSFQRLLHSFDSTLSSRDLRGRCANNDWPPKN